MRVQGVRQGRRGAIHACILKEVTIVFWGASSKEPFEWLHLRIGWLSREGVKEKP